MSSLTIPSLRDWLESILLPQYLDVLTDNGYDTVHKCALLTSSDLDRIGISRPGHKKRILSQLAKFDLSSNESTSMSGDDCSPVAVSSSKSADISEELATPDANITARLLVNFSNIFWSS